MKIRVLVNVLGKVTGQIVEEADRDFETFKTWATNKDRKYGTEICEVVNEPESMPSATEVPKGKKK